MRSSKTIKFIFIATLLVGFILAPQVTSSEGASEHRLQVVMIPSDHAPHGSIEITHDDNFTTSGFIGSGTAGDPYVLEGVNITTDLDCINIQNTRAHFIVKDCILMSANYDNGNGMYLENVSRGIVRDCFFRWKSYAMQLLDSEYLTLFNNTFDYNGSWAGFVADVDHSIFQANSLTRRRLFWYMATNCSFLDNYFSSDVTSNLLEVSHVTGCVVKNNTVHRGMIVAYADSSGLVFNNTIHSGDLQISNSVGTNVTGNHIMLNGRLMLFFSESCLITDNTIANGYVEIFGSSGLRFWTHRFESNIVNGKPLGYFLNESDTEIDFGEYSQVFVVNCTDSVFTGEPGYDVNLEIIGCRGTSVTDVLLESVEMLHSVDCSITNATLKGMFLMNVTDCTVASSRVFDAGSSGISVLGSVGCNLTGNLLYLNSYSGISVGDTHNMRIVNNTVYSNDEYGIKIRTGSNNTVIGNKLGWNLQGDGYDNGTSNHWDDGVSKGNYWSDYGGVGIYNVTGYAGSNDTYAIQLIDNDSPLDDSQRDVNSEDGAEPLSIIWEPDELFPTYYDVLLNGSTTIGGQKIWDSARVRMDPGTLDVGVYNFTLVMQDASSNTGKDTVLVRIHIASGPEISMDRSVAVPTPDDSVLINATITDVSGVASVLLSYTVGVGDVWTNATMSMVASHWTAAIPQQLLGFSVQYKVYAEDTLGNWAVSSTESYVVEAATEPPTSTSTPTTTGETPPSPLDMGLVLGVVAGVAMLAVIVVVAKRR